MGLGGKNRARQIKKAKCEDTKEHLWANLIKGRSGIPGSGIPSDWSILTDFVNTQALLTQSDEICDMAAVRDLSMSDVVFKSVVNNKLKDFPK